MTTSGLPLGDAIAGCLLGTAIGDALGLPAEGLSPRRQARLLGAFENHRLVFGRGMVSDDTEHACMTAHALITSAGDPQRFAAHLARELRWWFVALPAGVGLATLRASLKLLVGIPPSRSGVRSAGNGACMRSPILGVCHGRDTKRLADLVRASTHLTHRDPRAEAGALAVALAAWRAASTVGIASDDFVALLAERLALGGLAKENRELVRLVEAASASAKAGESTVTFAARHTGGGGVSGYVLHTVPVALHAWFRHGTNYRAAILDVIRAGGDTDTTAAITGAIVGAGVGPAGIPARWIDGLAEWPRTTRWITALARDVAIVVADGTPRRPPPLPPWPVLLGRNVVFLAIVLTHGFRRTLPPY
jgi:ADP-ribosylglycohydrolase